MTLYETRYGRLQYREHKCGIEICGYHGTDIRIDFREIVKALDKPVVAIGKKAFLSCKTIQELILTDDVAEGLIISQSVLEGEEVKEGSVIEVTVSSGMYFVISNY